MKQSKVFEGFSGHGEDLERRINEWLSEESDKIRIIQTTMATSDHNVTVLILYYMNP